MNPTQELRDAAAKLRSAARAAGAEDWTADHHPQGTIVRPAASTHSLFVLAANGSRAAGTPVVYSQIGYYMAMVGPTVGIALADWLDVMALYANDEGAAFLDEALAVARQILGSTDG